MSSLTTIHLINSFFMDNKQLFNSPKDKVDANRTSTNIQNFQNFVLCWLHTNIDEDNIDDIIIPLRQVVSTVHTFTDIDEFISFANDINDTKIFIIISEEFAQTTIPIIHDMPQVNSIYIFSINKSEHENWSKVKGIFTEISQICEILKKATREYDRNFISMSFVSLNNGMLKKTLNELDQSFMYTQILKEILLNIDFNQQHIKELINYCRENSIAQLNILDKFEKEYKFDSSICWYTSPCFLYSILNRALRTMEIDILIKMGFFVHDLHRHIEQLHNKQYASENQLAPFIVYRGQGLTQKDFDQMIETKGGLLSFNNFLSTSRNRALSSAFAESNYDGPGLVSVLFQITINPSISSIPFADITDVSYYPDEEEILFSMHAVFRIGQIKQINDSNRLWEIELTLTTDNDPQLSVLTEHIREETLPHLQGWQRLGQFLNNLGQNKKAQKLYEVLLDQTPDDYSRIHIYYQLGSVNADEANYEKAIWFYEKSIELCRQHCPSNYPDMLLTYNNIGSIYYKMGNYSKALLYLEQVLEDQQKMIPHNDRDLAICYGSIGLVHEKLGNYPKALSFYEKDLEISQKIYPSNHPELANAYASVGSIHKSIGHYSKALSYCKKSHEMRLKTLPEDHPDLAISHNNIGMVYGHIERYPEALTSYEKALEIYRKTLSPVHPQLAMTYLNTGFIYEQIDDFSKALSYYKKASEIFEKTLPKNHPDLSNAYSRIGGIYLKKGEYSEALTFYKKSLEINIRSLPEDHPDLATSYGNLAVIYLKMGKYSEAMKAHNKACEISKKNS